MLLDALTRWRAGFANVEVMHLLGFGDAYYNHPEFAESFRHNGLFLGPNMRKAVEAGRADYIPINLSEIEALFLDKKIELDVALLRVNSGPPWVLQSGSFSGDDAAAPPAARIRIAQVNDRMPRTFRQHVHARQRIRRHLWSARKATT